MISIFKALNPFNILWLAVMLFILRTGYILNLPPKLDLAFAEPFSRLLVPSSFQLSISPFYNALLASLLVFIQALLVNYLVNHYNLLGKPSFLPALMYITVSGLFAPFSIISEPLICNFLIIWVLFRLFSFYKSKDAKSAAYDLGMIVAIGSIIYLPFIYLFLVIWIGLIIFRPFNWREMLSAVMGYITIFFFLAVYYFMNDSLGQFYDLWGPLTTKFPDTINIKYTNYLVLVPVIIILVLALVSLQKNFFKSYVQVRKSFQLLFVVFIVTALSFYIKAAFRLNHFVLCAVPVSIFFSYYFLHAKRKWVYETLFLLLVACIIYFQFNTF